ncbi:stAR-related lipid transfer protein 9 isoform X1 [Dipodomys merriami]|uniref:stAR-related lipid transfer protein 9 isoform X1 n=2 Tax=Dipodomys merriami TaxID=94247 RepID=UPI0038560D28
MANVRVAVRVRPLSQRETKEGARIVVEVDDKVAKIRNLKVDSRPDGFGDSREKVVAFGFDYCYWSVSPEDPQYASQDVVFQDLGTEVLSGAAKGYNICLFAYGQTGSGKTYTMLGTPASVGLTPRICEGLFIKEEDCVSLPSSCNIKVSFLEIYNERVRDLLKQSDKKKSYTLRVREHPERGPYVQGLSEHVVTNYQQVIQLLEEGIANRITAATHVHEASSRSHAIFTIHYTQAILDNNCPSEMASKINLVDLAGSERADPNYCKDRMTEGANINKSLVTLGIVISTLAQNSQMFSNCRILSSTASNGGDCGIPSSSSGTSSQGAPSRRWSYIPYRDSVLTWLLKDSLGGNSKTIMVATVSPAHTSYNETISTLRYASNAKSIINKPRVNEDANVKLIRELKEEIKRLKAMLLSFELRNIISLNNEKDENLKELVLQNELRMDNLIKEWTQKWDDWQTLMEHYNVDISKKRARLLIDSSLPHLLALEDDVLSTGVVLYHLKEGTTKIGRIDSDQEQDIVLQGQWIERDHCTITSACGVVILRPTQGARCTVNGREVTAACRLTQGAVITLGKVHKFRFSHPAEAAVLRQRRQVGEAVDNSGSLEWLDLDGDVTASRLALCPVLWKERKLLGEPRDRNHQSPRDGEIQQQQCYVEDLRQEILAGQIRAEKELESSRACVHQQTKGNQQWLLRQEPWLASLQEQQADRGAGEELEVSVAPDAWIQTGLETPPTPLVRNQKRVVRLQFLRRHALRVAERSIRRRKVSFHLGRIIKNQRLQEAQRRLEQISTPCWPQDDSTWKSPCQIPLVPVPPHRSRWASCCSLGVQKFCSQHLSQLHSIFLNWDPPTTLLLMPNPTHQKPDKAPPADPVHQAPSFQLRIRHLCRCNPHPTGQEQLCWAKETSGTKGASTPDPCLTVSSHEAMDIQEVERVGKQPCQMASLGFMSVCQSVNKLKPKDKLKTLTPAIQTRSAKRLAASVSPQAEWQKDWDLGTHKPAKGAICCPLYSHGPKQAAGHGKGTKTFQAKAKPTFPNKTTKRQQKVLAARVRDIARQSFHLPHGNPLRRQHNSGNPDSMTALPETSPVVDHTREENDLSDADSNYSVDSLSCVCAEVQREPPKSEDPQGKWSLPEPENSESDNSQISEDSLAENGYQCPNEFLRDNHPTNHGHPRTRTTASLRGFCTPLDCGPCAQAHRGFSLDSLICAEQELREDQQEEPCLGSVDEMPAETFWHLPNSAFPVGVQEAASRPGLIDHRIEAKLNAVLPMSSSYYLDPHFQPHCECPKSEVEAGYFEQAGSSQCTQLLRGSPLVSMDSWFSCDSKINSGSPPGVVGSLCASPDIQEAQPCAEEKTGYRLTTEEQKPSGADKALPGSSRLLQGGPEPPCGARDPYPASASDPPKLPAWETQRLHPGIFEGREIPVITQQGGSEASHSSSVSSMLASSATSFIHVESLPERDWDSLQQKYLLELSHPVSDAVGELKQALFCPKEDSGSLAEASGKKGDTQVPVGPGISSNLNVNNFLVHLSRTRHLRTEKDQVSSSTKLESASDFLSTSDKEVSCHGAYSADVESLTSASAHVQVQTAKSKVPHSVTGAHEGGQNNLEEGFHGSRKRILLTSSDEYFFQNRVCRSNGTVATKAEDWLPDQALFRKKSDSQAGPLSQSSHPPPLREEKNHCQESADKAGRRHKNITSPSVPELYLHSAPWNPFPTSLHPPPLETFYTTKSRDVLTETALEIPAYREVRGPSPSPREAWGFHPSHQDLQEPHLENSLPMSSQSHDLKMASFHQVTTDRSVDLCAREVIGKLEECLGNIEESHSSVYCFFAHNRHCVPSTSTQVCEFESQVGILNIEQHGEREKAPVQSLCSASLDSSESVGAQVCWCPSEAEGEEDPGPSVVVLQAQAHEKGRQSPSGLRSGFVCETTDLGLEKDIPLTASAALKSRSGQHRMKKTMSQGNSPAHRWEGKNETGLVGKALYPKDSPEEFKLPGLESACEGLRSVKCSKKRHPGGCKGPRKSQVMVGIKGEPCEKKHTQNTTSADEMDKLIRSVRQLENSISEIESQQNNRLRASHTPGVSKESVFQDQKNHRRTGHTLRPGSSANHLSYKEPSVPRQIDDAIFRYSKAGGVEVYSCHRVTTSPFRSSEHAQDCQSVGAHTHTADVELDRASRGTRDPSGRGTAQGESTNTTLHLGRMNELARALPTRLEGSGKDTELGGESANSKEQTWDLESFEELETVKGFQMNQIAECSSGSEPEDPVVQGRLEQMARKSRRCPLKENIDLIKTQKLLNPSQHCLDTVCSQETAFPLLTQTDFSATTYCQDLRNNYLPLGSPRLPRNHLHASNSLNMSSVETLLDPTMLKIHESPLGTRVGHQDQSGGTRSPEGSVAGGFSMPPTAWYGSEMPTPMESDGQSVISDSSIPLGTEDWMTSSTSSHDQGRDLRIALMALSTQEDLGSETEAAIPKKRSSSLNRISGRLEKRVSFLLEEDTDQSRETREKTEEAEDQGPPSSASLEPISLPQEPEAEPVLSDSSVHASMCLAILKEIRQVTTQRKQLGDFAKLGTVLPHYELSLEPEICWQMDPLQVLDRTQNEDEAQGLSATPGHLSPDEQEAQATLLCEDDFQPLSDSEMNEGPRHHSRASSPRATSDKGHAGELRYFREASEQFVCHSSSETTGMEEEAPRAPSSADPWVSHRLSSAMERDRRVSSQAPCCDPGRAPQRQSHLAAWETEDGRWDNRPGLREPKRPALPYGSGSSSFFVAAQGGKRAHVESQPMVCDFHSATSLSGPHADAIQCPEASSTDLEEAMTSAKHPAVLAGALRKVSMEAPKQQHVKWKEKTESMLPEACRGGGKAFRPTLPNQRPRPDPRGVGEEPPCACQTETLASFVLESPEDSGPLGLSRKEEESKAFPCQPLGSALIAGNVCTFHSSPPLCARDGDPRKGIARAHHSPFVEPSRFCEMDEGEEGSSTEPDMPLAHGLELKERNVGLRPRDSSPVEPSTTAAGLSRTQGCSSSFSPGARASSFTPSTADGSSGLVGDPEKKGSTELEGSYLESPRTLTENSIGDQHGQAADMEPEPPVTAWGLHSPNGSEGFTVSELAVEEQHRQLENTIRSLLEKTQPKSLDPQAKCVRLKHVCSPQADCAWEEEEQQRDEPSGEKDTARHRNPPPSDGDGLHYCQARHARRGDAAMTNSPVFQSFFSGFEDTASGPLEQSEVPQPAARRPGQPCSDGKQPAPHHRHSHPIIAVFSGPQHFKSSSRPRFSVINSSRSLQELMSKACPSPREGDMQSLCPSRRSSRKPMARAALRAEDSNQMVLSNLYSSSADHGAQKPVTPPYPTLTTCSCMPAPSCVSSCTYSSWEQAPQGKPETLGVQVRPENCFSLVDKGMLTLDSSDSTPSIPPPSPDGSVCIGWKQYVFGSTADLLFSQKPLNVAHATGMDSGLEDQNSPLNSQVGAHARTLSRTHSSTEHAQSCVEAGKVLNPSLALRDPYVLTGTGVAPTLDTSRRLQFQGSSDGASYLRSEPLLAEENAATPVDRAGLLGRAEAHPGGLARRNTLEQGTQTPGCRRRWSCTDISTRPDSDRRPACDLASWSSMHSLSLRLSQLLHNTSQLLGSLSQPNVASRKQTTNVSAPEEALPALKMEGATQTTLDKGTQTDLISPLPPTPAPGTKPPEVNVSLEVLASGIKTTSLGKGDTPVALEKREAEETPPKMAASPEVHEGRSQSPPTPLSPLRLQKVSLEQSLPSVSPLASEAAPPPAPQPGCPGMDNSPHIPCPPRLVPSTPDFPLELGVQKQPGPASATVDRASSPILILSASCQESDPAQAPSTPPPGGHLGPSTSPQLGPGASRPPGDEGRDGLDGSLSMESQSQGQKHSERSTDSFLLEPSSPRSPQRSSRVQAAGQPQPVTATGAQCRQPSPVNSTGAQSRQPSPTTSTGAQCRQPSPTTSTGAQCRQPSPTTSTGAQCRQPSPTTSTGAQCRQPSPVNSTRAQCRQPSPTTSTEVQCRQPPPMTSTGAQCRQPSPTTSTGAQCRQPSPTTSTGAQCRQPSPTTSTGAQCRQPSPVNSTGAQCRQPSPVNSTGAQCRQPSPMTSTGAQCRQPPPVTSTGAQCRQPSPTTSTGAQCRQPPPTTSTGAQCRQPPPVTSTGAQCRQPSLPSRSQRLPGNSPYPEPGPLNLGGPGRPPAEPHPMVDLSSPWRGPQPLPRSADTAEPQGPASGSPHACRPQKLLRSVSHMCLVSEPQHHSQRDRYGVQDDSSGELGMSEELRTCSRQKRRRPPQLPYDQSHNAEWFQTKPIPLQTGVHKPSLSMELTEAKLHRGFGEADALLQVLQNGTGEALAPEPPAGSWEELYTRQRKAIETLRRERAERLQHFYQTQNLCPKKQLNLQLTHDPPTWEPDLPSRRREYLQQLRKEVVETTRSPEEASRCAEQTSDIELMLRDYQRAREEAKLEIARARDQLWERTEQEKLGIRQKIISQLLKEEEKLHTLVNSSPQSTSSNGSLSSGITSGYNSSSAFSGQPQSPEAMGDTDLSDSRDTWLGEGQCHPAVRNSHLYVAGSAWKSSVYSRRTSLGSCYSQSSISSLVNCFSASSYQELAKHIVDMTMADVMAACSDNLHNLFSCQATAGWNYQGEEQEVQVYYKEFSSTRHGFLGAGVVSQPLPHVWAAVSDPTLWPLYHKPIHTARLHQRVTNSISLVYLVCDTTLCALKQPRDFCCVCVEAKESELTALCPQGHLSIMAAQSVYDTSMPRPSRRMVRGEVLPSAWILQPVSVEGKEITRVIFLAQVELGAPGFPPHLLSSFIKQQPLVVAKLASFLGS